MSRTQARGRARRDQLLDSAEELFFRKGFEAASIQELMDAAGVSKGAVYHHFKSKDDVLEALSVRLAEAAADSVADVVTDQTIGAVDRLNLVLLCLRARKAQEWPRLQGAFETLFAPGNVALFHRISQAMNRVMAPLFAKVLEGGIAEGSFRITDAEAVSEMILQLEASVYAAASHAAQAPGDQALAARVQRRVQQIGVAIDRLLGLPDHTVAFAEDVGGGSQAEL